MLDAKQTGGLEIERMRAVWAGLQNDALVRAEVRARVDHRSLEVQRNEALEHGDTFAAEALHRAAEVELGPAANAIERCEMRDAEAEGWVYEAVTAREAQVQAARQARAMFDELREELRARAERARETYGLAREDGRGRVSAGLAAFRAAAERDCGRDEAREQDRARDDIRARLGRVMERRDKGQQRDMERSEMASRWKAPRGAGRISRTGSPRHSVMLGRSGRMLSRKGQRGMRGKSSVSGRGRRYGSGRDGWDWGGRRLY